MDVQKFTERARSSSIECIDEKSQVKPFTEKLVQNVKQKLQEMNGNWEGFKKDEKELVQHLEMLKVSLFYSF